MNKNLKVLIECAIMVALATALSVFKIFEMPFGGSVTLASMLPIAIISCRYGVKIGFATGFVGSIIQLLLGLNTFAYTKTLFAVIVVVLIDYILAFSVIGLAGMFRGFNQDNNNRKLSSITFGSGVFVVIFLRFVCHLVSGAVVWHELTKEWYSDDPTHIVNTLGPWAYSFVYNILYMAPELLITLVAGIALTYFLNFRNDKLIYVK